MFVAKGGQEFYKNVVRSHIATNDLRVLGGVENVLQFFGINHVFSVQVELVERSVNCFLASGVWCTSDADQELVIVDVAIFAGV